jgi:hypothetical protein
MSATVHACPLSGNITASCCGLTPFELPRGDAMSAHPELVTCTAWVRDGDVDVPKHMVNGDKLAGVEEAWNIFIEVIRVVRDHRGPTHPS